MTTTTEAAHTAGPWEVEYAHNSWPRGAIQSEGKRGLFAHDRPRAEQEANARLIAAAPDLLAALKGVLFAQQHLLGQFDADDLEAVEKARAAIAKATGAA